MASVELGEGHPVAGVGWRTSGADMKMARIKLKGETAVYHCLSRIVGRQLLLDDLCKEKLVALLGKKWSWIRR